LYRSAWTYNSPWLKDYPVFDGAAATNSSIPQGLQKQLAVFVRAKNRLAMVAPIHDACPAVAVYTLWSEGG
jgi:hypothetical protein